MLVFQLRTLSEAIVAVFFPTPARPQIILSMRNSVSFSNGMRRTFISSKLKLTAPFSMITATPRTPLFGGAMPNYSLKRTAAGRL